MIGFFKLLLILGLVTFFSYTFYVEPSASNDPAGAISRSAQRLATLCERNREECEFLGDVGEGIGQAASVGWKLATGQGRLVFVPNDGRSSGDVAAERNQSSRSYHRPVRSQETSGDRSYERPERRSLGDLIRSTNLFGGGGGGARDTGYRDTTGRYTSDNCKYDNQPCN